jgi:S1-C subfamily serine protease
MNILTYVPSLLAATFIVFSTPSVLHAQIFSLPDRIRDAKLSSLSIEALQVDQDINKVRPSLLGSAFFVKKSDVAYAITNAHVVAALRKNQQLLVGANLKRGKAYLEAELVKADHTIDVAVLKLGKTLFNSGEEIEFDQAFVGVSLFSPDSLIQEGVQVLVIGYPLNIGVESLGNQPVSRVGIVAQSTGPFGTFLIDGIVSHGNSGSLVFKAETLQLLGMVIGFKGDKIDFVDETGALLARLPHNSGLSLCISANKILALIP